MSVKIFLNLRIMGKNEKTSPKIAKIASKGLKNPKKLTPAQVQKIAGSALTQTADKPKKKVAKKK